VIAYFGAPGLPRTLQRVPVETVSRGMTWLRRRPEANGRRTALLGVSRGAELALLSDSLDPSLARTVIALVPGAYVFPGLPGGAAWTRNGRALPTGNAIPVERIRGTVLVAGAADDNVWDSADFADTIAETIGTRGRARVVRRVYAGAGHGIATPIPFTPDVADIGLGGTTGGDERAREDLWPLILDLLGS
jgi:dienelactone hydrolase